MHRRCVPQNASNGIPKPNDGLMANPFASPPGLLAAHAVEMSLWQLRQKREELNTSIASDEEEKAKIQNDLRILTERLSRINDNLSRKITSRTEYDKTITETEGAYQKVGAATRA